MVFRSIILLLGVFLVSCETHSSIGGAPASGKEKRQHAAASGSAQDTVFLIRDIDINNRHVVYIEKNREAEARKQLFDFSLRMSDTDAIQENYNYLLSGAAPHNSLDKLIPQNLHGLATQWLPLRQYKGRLYLYKSCESGLEGKDLVHPYGLLRFRMDGTHVTLLKQVSKIDATTFQLRFFAYWNGAGKSTSDTITIHMLDRTGQVAIWEYADGQIAKHYELCTTPAGAGSFDLIVCDTYNKVLEWNGFEPTDLTKLMLWKN